MEVPETMEQWDEMLHAMKDLKGGHPLAINFKDWYGVQTNYMFAAAYECAFRQFINRDGKMVYGSAEPGYRDFMEQMNQWYEEGIMDPDFTRTLEDYNAGIAEVGKSTICNLLKKEIPLPEKHSITKVCIDDFAFRKRQTYGTIMVDIDTHRVVDLRASREVEDVAEWLRSYPNIRIVSRDGSVSYKSAIEQAGMDIQQVSDRFHLLKGLTDAAKNSYHACFIPVRQDM